MARWSSIGVEGVAAGLLIVEDVVLDVAHDVVGLHAAGELADHGAGEDGVFAGVLEVAAVARLADEVDAAADGHVEAHGAEFAADDGAVEEGGVRVPGRGHAEDGRERCGITALVGGHAHAVGGVGEVDVGQAQARDAGDEAGAAVVARVDIGAGAEDAPAVAVDELDLLVEGHLVDHQVGAGVGIERGIHPGSAGGRRWRAGALALGRLRCRCEQRSRVMQARRAVRQMLIGAVFLSCGRTSIRRGRRG